MTDAYIGLGSNVGDRLQSLSRACVAMSVLPGTTLVTVSHAYDSEPWGVTDQPSYANAVARLHTTLRADQLLGYLKDIERSLGRTDDEERFGPRAIDLDILLFGDEEWATDNLCIPHPRMAEREFVLVPLKDVWPDARWPDGRPIADKGWVGRILGDLGPIPEAAEFTVGPSGEGERAGASGAPTDAADEASAPMPPGEVEWVPVETISSFGRIDAAPDISMGFLAMVLEQEKIPFLWDPHPPDVNYNPWGLTTTIRLMVPSPYAERAQRVLREAAAAPPEEPDA